jgi:hypothetical protein
LSRVRATIFAVEKAVSITYSECVSVALIIQYEKLMRHIILSPVACLALQYFSTLSHKKRDVRGKVIEHKIFLYNFRSTHLILRRIQRNVVVIVRLHVMCPLFFSGFNQT